jgi:hypothetical protein
MSHSTVIPVNITLDGHNYREWAFCVETALWGHGLLFHLTDDPPAVTPNNSNASEIKTWNINDGKVMAAIVNSVKQSIIMTLSPFKTAKPMWSYLHKRYVQDSGALLHTLMQKVHLIVEYSAFDRLVGHLISMVGHLISMVPQCTTDECPAYKFIEKFFT